MGKSTWRPEMMADLTGKTILVTGANSGIGLEAVKLFAGKGAEVIMACRNVDKAKAAAEAVKAMVADARLVIMALDLADLASVKAFSEAVKQRFAKLDVLLNNAGLMAPPLQRTRDGFEMQFGTNHLGHFALTGQLVELLEFASDPRIVQISSLAHRGGKLMWGNLNAEKKLFPLALLLSEQAGQPDFRQGPAASAAGIGVEHQGNGRSPPAIPLPTFRIRCPVEACSTRSWLSLLRWGACPASWPPPAMRWRRAVITARRER